MSRVRYDVREVELRANISTKSREGNWEDNNYAITVYFDLDIDTGIAGLIIFLYIKFHIRGKKNFIIISLHIGV